MQSDLFASTLYSWPCKLLWLSSRGLRSGAFVVQLSQLSEQTIEALYLEGRALVFFGFARNSVSFLKLLADGFCFCFCFVPGVECES